MDAPKRICLGVITGAHGIRGAVRIKSYTQVPRDIENFGPLGDADCAKMFELRVESDTPKGLIARIAGVEDRNGAEWEFSSNCADSRLLHLIQCA